MRFSGHHLFSPSSGTCGRSRSSSDGNLERFEGGIVISAKPAKCLAAILAGLELIADVRSFTGIYCIFAVRPQYPNARTFFDEINIARVYNVPVDWTVWPSSILIIIAWILFVPRLNPNRWLKLPAVILGPIIGIFVWAQIGPFILP